MTIEFLFDMSVEPTVGSFEVTEGADALGCSGGSAVNENVTEDTVESELTCDAGSRAGVITIHFRPTAGEEENTFEGPWEIVRVSTEFEGLPGEGDFTAVRDIEALTIAQVQTGEFRLE